MLPRAGRLTAVTLSHVLDPARGEEEKTLRVGVATSSSGDPPLTGSTLSAAFGGEGTRGDTYRLDVPPVALDADRAYYLILRPLNGALVLSGSTIATEGSWDDALPLHTGGHDPYGVHYQGYPLQMIWEDTPQKRARLQYVLEHTDYLIISSNRFYAALPRNPRRWPMTIDYYRALFDGTLGFELVGDFTSNPNLGPLQIDDQSADELFTVYDHPRVMVFRKTAGFSAVTVATVLGHADLGAVVHHRADQVTDAPVVLALPKHAESAQH